MTCHAKYLARAQIWVLHFFFDEESCLKELLFWRLLDVRVDLDEVDFIFKSEYEDLLEMEVSGEEVAWEYDTPGQTKDMVSKLVWAFGGGRRYQNLDVWWG